jgi:hypothetical protein
MVLRSPPSSLVSKVSLEFLLQILLNVGSHWAKILSIWATTRPCSTVATNCTAVLHYACTVFAASNAHRSIIARRRDHIVDIFVTGGVAIAFQELAPILEFVTFSVHYIADAGPGSLVRANVQVSLECIIERDTVCHVLVLRVAILPIELLFISLFHEQDEVWIVRILNNTREVHGVKPFVFSLKHRFKAEIVMSLLQGVKSYVLVMPSENIFVVTLLAVRGVPQD